MYLYHFFDKTAGSFRSLSDLSAEDAQTVLENINITKPASMCAERDSGYLERRRKLENIIRSEFIGKGGTVLRSAPYYMVIEYSPWLSTWYENCGYIKIPVEEFDINTLSFTYGDSMPTFSPLINDGKEYRRKVYTYGEILEIIDKYGMPQDWNDDGRYDPERYIEVQVWSDETVCAYK